MPSSPRRGRAALLLFISPRFAAEQDPRVAYCFSGHVRSFVQPRVHESIHRELVGALSPSAGQRELFFYVALDDEVPPAAHALPDAPAHAGAERLEYSSSDDGLGAAASHARPMFEPAPTSRDAFEATVSRLWRVPQDVAYRAIAYHEPGAGLIPHACPGGLPPEAAFAQWYKMLACFRMVEARERALGARFDWVVRARPDVGWLARVPASVAAFANDRAYVPQPAYWPMSDIFALVPRNLAGDFFGAVASFYACGDNVSTSETCGNNVGSPLERWFPPGVGAPEALLFKHVHSHRVPVQPTDFPLAIVRATEGARCDALHQMHHGLCATLVTFEQIQMPVTASQSEDDAAAMCEALLTGWWWRRCAARFPPARGFTLHPPPLDDTAALNSMCSVDVGDMLKRESRSLVSADVPARVSRWTWCAITDHGRNRRGEPVGSHRYYFALNMPMILALTRSFVALLEPVLRSCPSPETDRGPVTARALAARLSPPQDDGLAAIIGGDQAIDHALRAAHDAMAQLWAHEVVEARQLCQPTCSTEENAAASEIAERALAHLVD